MARLTLRYAIVVLTLVLMLCYGSANAMVHSCYGNAMVRYAMATLTLWYAIVVLNNYRSCYAMLALTLCYGNADAMVRYSSANAKKLPSLNVSANAMVC